MQLIDIKRCRPTQLDIRRHRPSLLNVPLTYPDPNRVNENPRQQVASCCFLARVESVVVIRESRPYSPKEKRGIPLGKYHRSYFLVSVAKLLPSLSIAVILAFPSQHDRPLVR